MDVIRKVFVPNNGHYDGVTTLSALPTNRRGVDSIRFQHLFNDAPANADYVSEDDITTGYGANNDNNDAGM